MPGDVYQSSPPPYLPHRLEQFAAGVSVEIMGALLLARATKAEHELNVTTSDNAVDDIVVEPELRVPRARPNEACAVDNWLATIIGVRFQRTFFSNIRGPCDLAIAHNDRNGVARVVRIDDFVPTRRNFLAGKG